MLYSFLVILSGEPKQNQNARVGRLQTGSNPSVNFIAGRPKAALLLWCFGDFRCDVSPLK